MLSELRGAGGSGLRIHRFLLKIFLAAKFVNMFPSAFHSTAGMIKTLSFSIFAFTAEVFLVWKYNIALHSPSHALLIAED